MILYNLIKKTITEATTLTVGNICITHAKNTDDTANGIYTLDDIADGKSLDYGYYDGRKKISLVNNTVTFADPSAGWARWWITCAFKHAAQATYDNLLTLLGQQLGGVKLALFPSITDLPPLIIGNLTIRDLKKADVDLAYRAFVFSFEGC